MLKQPFFLLLLCLLSLGQHLAPAQTVPQKLAAAFTKFQEDPQLQFAVSGIYVAEAGTGKVLFEQNGKAGLVPASTLKVLTAASAYELLGKDFRYETAFAWQNTAAGTNLLVLPTGDPTFGSWRWQSTREETVVGNLVQAIRKFPVVSVNSLQVAGNGWSSAALPGGWLWQDIGNYYGAGASQFNWRENQYDVVLRSGKNLGDPVAIVRTEPALAGYTLQSEVTAGAAGSGDSAYIYFPLQGTTGTIRGSIPLNKAAFKIAGALPDPAAQFAALVQERLTGLGIKTAAKAMEAAAITLPAENYTVFHTVASPPLDSIVYWLNRKSINLYAEALLKTMAFRHSGEGATGKGTALLENYWSKRGIAAGALQLADGSGLSPVNRATPQALVQVLQYARRQAWYSGFYDSLPLYNGMKMKSGTMRGVKGFCGYYRSKSGQEYVFAFVVNNYTGTPAAVTRKMYQVLDALK